MKNLSTEKKVVYSIILLFLLCCFVFVGTRDFSVDDISEQEKFSEEYKNVPRENVFKYANSSKVFSLINQGTGIIFFGFPSNEFSGKFAEIVNEVAMEKGITEIYYYNFLEDRDNNNATYESIVNFFELYVYKDDEGHFDINAPTLAVIKDGKTMYFNDETSRVISLVTSDYYWNEYNVNMLKHNLSYVFDKYLEETNGK